MHPLCNNCYVKSCYEEVVCPECGGSGIFIGAGIETIEEPHFYNLSHPCKLPCRVCKGEGFVVLYCPYFYESS